MARHGLLIAEDDEFHAGAGDGYVHAPQVAQESYLSFVVGAHERDDDDVAFLSLETVDGVHGDEATVGFEELVALDEAAQVLHLCAVGRDDAHVDALLEDARLANLREVLLQHFHGLCCLEAVDSAERFADELLVAGRCVGLVAIGGGVGGEALPLHRHVVVEDAAVAHLWGALHLAAVEPVGGEAHDFLVHAVLHAEQGDGLGVVVDESFHERAAQSGFQRRQTLHCGRQLAVVSGEHHARDAADGNPTGGLQCLCGFIYK